LASFEHIATALLELTRDVKYQSFVEALHNGAVVGITTLLFTCNEILMFDLPAGLVQSVIGTVPMWMVLGI